ncbi:MAG: ribosomal protein S18 acetylase RimI-like enzyme [Psychromonas sp.]|jgi:ribosomal protein S18 acetylase RimI-like enzyme|uniref:GNAT family N-acetyltransferase n=1 Tax=Psychromonas sp. TaxID=1884585 RepID=UPI0039E6C810
MKIRPATEQDLLIISGWLLSEFDAKNWGGPAIHFPLHLAQLKIDIQWHVARAYVVVDKKGGLIGFAQVFNKFNCKHLGRIVVSPTMRGKKMGYQFMDALLNCVAENDVSFSLFVYEHNLPAKKLYQSLGFEVRPYPKGLQEIAGCLFMVKKI